MKIFRFLLIFCLPAFILSPIPSVAFSQEPGEVSAKEVLEKPFDLPRDASGRINPWMLLDSEQLSIDRYFSFIDLTSNEAFLESLSEEEFDLVVDFVTQMVQSSIPDSLEDLKDAYEIEIDQLIDDLYGEPKWSLSYSHDFEIVPAFYSHKHEVVLCKSWLRRRASRLANWCSRHRKPLIVAAVVVSVVVVAVVTGGVGGSSATAVGGGIIEETLNDKPSTHINKPGEVFVDDGQRHSPPPNLPPQDEQNFGPSASHPSEEKEVTSLEQAQTLVFERAEEAKWEIAESNYTADVSDKPSLERAKEVTKTVVSNIVHDVFESVSKIGTTWHQIHPNSTPEEREAYKEYVALQHEKIDEIFGTYRPDYSLESQEYSEAFKAAVMEELGHYPEMQMGELPPPGALINVASRAATVASRALGVAARSGTVVGTAAAMGSMVNWESPIPMTQVNDTIGWKVGEPINNRTINGSVPTWSSVRYRYWRNEALNVKNGVTTKALELECYEVTEENIKRMERGLAPQFFSDKSGRMESVELHHDPAQRDGGLFDVEPLTPEMHAQKDPHRYTGN